MLLQCDKEPNRVVNCGTLHSRPPGKGLKGDSSLGAAEREGKGENAPDESTYYRLLISHRWTALKQTQAFEMVMNLL